MGRERKRETVSGQRGLGKRKRIGGRGRRGVWDEKNGLGEDSKGKVRVVEIGCLAGGRKRGALRHSWPLLPPDPGELWVSRVPAELRGAAAALSLRETVVPRD